MRIFFQQKYEPDDDFMQKRRKGLMVALTLICLVIIMMIVSCIRRWLPPAIACVIFYILYGLFVAGILKTLSFEDTKTDLASITETAFANISFSSHTVAIIGVVGYEKTLKECNNKRIAGLLIGTGSTVLLIVSLSVIYLFRKRIPVETNASETNEMLPPTSV